MDKEIKEQKIEAIKDCIEIIISTKVNKVHTEEIGIAISLSNVITALKDEITKLNN